MLRLSSVAVLLSVALAPLARAQDPVPPKPAAPAVEVPTFANPTCPIMGKKVSLPLFVDTELGRFYVCCKPCYRKVLADVRAAHQTAYPVVERVANEVCPVSGARLDDDAVETTLQGYRFRVARPEHVAAARAHSQTTLVKLTRPAVKDVGNTTCPITGTAVVANAFVLIGDELVHLASPKAADEVAKDPAAALAKAKAIARAPGAPPARTEPGK